jgi:hypothetical protein
MHHCPGAFFRLALLVCLSIGCTTTTQSNTARTATEQLLVSNAVDQALNKVDFSTLSGTAVYVEDKQLDCVDKGYILGSIRHRLLRNNAQLVAKPEDATVILEVRSGGVGTDMAHSFLGIPSIVLPGMLTIPEVKLINRESQKAVAKIGMVTYDAKTRQILGEGGVSSAKSDDNNTYVFGIGPFQNGTLRKEVDHTTPIYQGQPYNELPAQVAFGAPAGKDAPGSVRFTSGEKE